MYVQAKMCETMECSWLFPAVPVSFHQESTYSRKPSADFYSGITVQSKFMWPFQAANEGMAREGTKKNS